GGNRGQHRAKERRHDDETRVDEYVIRGNTLDPGNRVVSAADEEQPHERTHQAGDQPAPLPERSRQVADDDAVGGAHVRDAAPAATVLDGSTALATCVRAK